MAVKGSRFRAIVLQKCPRCHKGDMFLNKNPYALNDLGKMPKRCPVCGQNFEPEAGFYYGAMYLSYAIGVFSCLILFGLLFLIFHLDTLTGFIIVASLWLLSSPYLFRFCRALWLSLYVNRHRDI